MRTCAECGAALSRTHKDQVRTVAGTTFLVRAPGFVCKACRALFMPGDVLERVDLEVASVLASKCGSSGETLRFVRKALALRGFELADLLGVTGETVSRWEHDQRPVDLSAWIIVGSLVLERAGHPTETLPRLLAMKKPSKLPATVRLSLENRAGIPRREAPARTTTKPAKSA